MPTLLYHTGALGDFITTLPALALWKKETRPADRLVLLGKSTIGALALDAGLIDEAWDIDSSRFIPLFCDDYSSSAADLLSAFDAAIVFSKSPSPLLANLRKSGIAELHLQEPFPATPGMHVVDYHLSLFADPETLALQERSPQLSPSSNAFAQSSNLLSNGIAPVALHPGSGSALKNWPIDRYRELADHLRRRGLPIAWIRGPADIPFEVLSGDYSIDEPPLPILAAFLAGCRLFIGNDSGVAHLAAAVGCATLAIFGPSDPAVWSPRGPWVEVVYNKINCSPCHRLRKSEESCKRSCLERFSVEDVLGAIEKA
jgi:ADP-heptose:LPS heptosyltransferase